MVAKPNKPPLSRWRRFGEPGLALAVFLLLTILLQWLAGAYANGFGAHPDEAAHFVTALMVRDFIAAGSYADPMGYAHHYYLHYPKVAIGHWPPLLYGALGTWLLVFNPSRAAALIFIALTTCLTAWMIYFTARRLISRAASWFAATLFIFLPLVQQSAMQVMTELPVTMLMLASTVIFARFARTERWQDGLSFGLVASAAILTRGSAWALALVPPLTILLTLRFGLLKRAGLWIATVPVLVLCVPWYVLTRGMSEGAWAGSSAESSFLTQAIIAFPTIIAAALGAALLIAAAFGFWMQVVRPWRARAVAPEWAALTAMAVSTILMHCIIPASIEGRFMVTVMPAAVLFAAAGADGLGPLLGDRLRHHGWRASVYAAVAAYFAWQTFQLPIHLQNRGFDRVVHATTISDPRALPTYLIVSDPRGEGSMVAAIASTEIRPKSFVLRGSKILASEDWLGRGSAQRFESAEHVGRVLAQIPVSIVIIDTGIAAHEWRPYHDQVKSVVAETAQWQFIGAFPATRNGRLRQSVLQAYRRRVEESGNASPATINLPMISKLMQRTSR